MLVHKSKNETTDYKVVFASEDIDLLHTIAAENIMVAKALHNEPSEFDAYWFNHLATYPAGDRQSRTIPFQREAATYFIEKLREYADASDERAEHAAQSAPEGFGDRAWFDRTILGEAALMFACELDEKFTKIQDTELEAEARSVIASSATTADQWLRTLTEGQ